MKRLFIIFMLLAIICIPSLADSRPRIALVLSGGIATRGLSEIGVIKALEEENIPISYVAGTSMGAVLGSLLAQGYTAGEIEKIAKSINWMEAFVQHTEYKHLLLSEKEKYGKYLFRIKMDGLTPRFPQSLVKGQKPSLLFTEVSIQALDVQDFDKFVIPFRANATDLETGQEVVFSSGYLPQVLQASSAVPMMLPPVEIEGKLLIDGGTVNNLPINLVEKFRPHLIIAVNVGTGLRSKEELNSFFPILSQNLSLAQMESAQKYHPRADILIEPRIARYSFADFDKIDEIIQAGYEAARSQIPALKKLIQQKGLSLKTTPAHQIKQKPIKSISITGNSIYSKWELYELLGSSAGEPLDLDQAEKDRRALRNKYFFDGYKLAEVSYLFNAKNGKLTCEISEGRIDFIQFAGRKHISDVFLKDKIRYQQIFNIQDVTENVDRLYATGYFETVGFKVVPSATGYNLLYVLEEKYHNTLALGLRYDTRQQLSLLADLTLNHLKSQNLQQTFSFKVGQEYNYQLLTEFWPPQFGQNLVGEAALFYNYQSQDLYSGSQINSTFYYLSKGMRLAATANLAQLGKISAGTQMTFVTYDRIFSLLPEEKITKFFIRSRFDFRDEPLLPRQGVLARFEYQQAFPGLGENHDFSKGMIDLAGYYPLPWQHVIYAKNKIYLGKGTVPLSERYRLGGEATLLGFGYNQFVGKDMVQARLGYRLPLFVPPSALLEGVYLSLIQDFGVAADQISDIKPDKINAGVGAEINFNTFFGLAARFSLGFGQRTYGFFTLGNEF